MGPHGALGPGALGPGLLGPQGHWDPGTLGPWDPGTGPLGTRGPRGRICNRGPLFYFLDSEQIRNCHILDAPI